MNGILVVDKPTGMTSHDVVQRVRRLLKTRSVGHAGTLDPLATGVLVVAVGEGTKLVPYLQAADKSYDVVVQFGVATDSLDADGTVVEEKDVPALSVGSVQSALDTFVGTHPQEVPAFSAVKVGGKALHKRARRGEAVEAPVRDATLRWATVKEVDGNSARISIECRKGFFVRSLARDLALKLGTVGHVVSLRRTSSGAFALCQAVTLAELEKADEPAQKMISIEEGVTGLGRVTLTEEGVLDARHGRAIVRERVEVGWPEDEAPVALLSQQQKLVAIGTLDDNRIRIARGFNQSDPGPATVDP